MARRPIGFNAKLNKVDTQEVINEIYYSCEYIEERISELKSYTDINGETKEDMDKTISSLKQILDNLGECI